MANPRSKLEQSLGVAVLCLLLLGCVIVLLPFVSALLWGIVLSISCWPAYRRSLCVSGNKQTVSALIMVLGMILIVLLPFAIVGITLADNVSALTTAVRKWAESGPPAPPEWLGQTPVIGQKAVDTWKTLASDTAKLLQMSKGLIQLVSAWLLRGGLRLGRGFLELALSVLISFFLLRDGIFISERLRAVVERISGARGQKLLVVAGNTVRGVVYGILGTALVQAVLAGIGFGIAGVPGTALLALLTFFASVVPVVGTGLVWIPAALWLVHQGSSGWAVFLAVWGLAVGSIDNFLKPWLISQGSHMPFVPILLGVFGGALAFGLIGIFLGPTLLAVGWRLLQEWTSAVSGAPGSVSEDVASQALPGLPVGQPNDSASHPQNL